MIFNLFLLFAKIGFFSFGGGYPMAALIFQEGQIMVGLTADEFAVMLGLELLASGPVALNAATYVGYIKGGLPGAFAATAGSLVAPVVLTSIIWFFLQKFKENRYVKAFLSTIKIACGAALLTTALNLGRDIFINHKGAVPWGDITVNASLTVSWIGLLLCLICLILGIKFKMNPIIIILGSAVAGAFLL